MLKQLWQIFRQFLLLGCISFGGPAAHVGYFYQTFVKKLQWLDDQRYANLLSLSQLLPGPGSSQMGFAIGMHRGGVLGGFTAFIAFTLPSFFLMYWLAVLGLTYADNAIFQGVISGLKLFAVVVVAHATVSLGKKFCHNSLTLGIAVATAVAMLLQASLLNQVLVLMVAAVIGRAFYQRIVYQPNQTDKQSKQSDSKQNASDSASQSATDDNKPAWRLPVVLSTFAVLLAAVFVLPNLHPAWQLFGQFYQTGSLVFGGGHVVLPVLEQVIGNDIGQDEFLLGYAGAQAVPGPMFSLGAYLGAVLSQEYATISPFLGALLATLGIFLPGFLLVIALEGVWQQMAKRPKIAGAIAGINASVVGLLISALYMPVFVSSVTSPERLALAIVGYYLLASLDVPIVWLVLGFALCGVVVM